ncbi:NB-ARC [Arabidopsis suecica]|uniref:NB-ARC n=1 Tax=Arabidopsis suecica TaxID=45249 RepID=A0A8T1YQN5_ARASU|nr:NB-ARC [Arabidopsis suecica]
MGGCVSLQIACDQTLSRTCGCLFGDGNYIHLMEANLDALQKTMQELDERRDDLLRRVSIEENQGLQRLAQVQGWFSRVEDIGSQVSDLLKEKSTETKRLCLFGYCSSKCISSCEYGKKVSKKLKEVTELLSKGGFEVVAEKVPAAKVEKKHIQTTVGLDSMVEKAWNSLINSERTTLGLYGMGGVGKTTLLALINNKFVQMVDGFKVVIWVVVSKDLQNGGIQNQILGRLRLDKEWKQETEKEKASSIYNILTRKKFVLLLDDLWSEVDLNEIGVPPPTRDNGSKIVFTTRSKEVCKDMKADDEMKVECLSRDEAWVLFRNIVGETPLKCHQDIPTLARKVAEKCCGLPLALNVIGKAMACKEDVHEWRHAINVLNSSSHEFPGMEEKILSILKFSYDGLGDEKVKLCFLYCSLFPEDYELKKEELIEYWICEGFINGNRDEDGSNNQGHAIIGSLIRAHLLMDGQFTTMVKMHDVLREMALWISSNFGKQEKKLCVKSGAQLCNIPKDINWEIVRRISLMSNQIAEISCCPTCPNLSTLLLRNNSLVDISGEFFRFMPVLVVLDLSKNRSLYGLPEEISCLSSLQYLNLSSTWIKSLPVGLKGLSKLISLDLEFTFGLESIAGIGTSLPNLQVLKLFHSRVGIDTRLMEELQLLQDLKILTANVEDASILESIQGVEGLASSIRGLCLRNMFEEVVILNTVALGGLRRLAVQNSKILEINIDWENKEREELLCTSSLGFKHLSTVSVYSLEGSKNLTWLLFAQNLRYLTVSDSPCIEEIINWEQGMSISNVCPDILVPLGKLESLEVTNLYALKRICSNPPALPNLRQFVVERCPNLPKAATEFLRYEQE